MFPPTIHKGGHPPQERQRQHVYYPLVGRSVCPTTTPPPPDRVVNHGETLKLLASTQISQCHPHANDSASTALQSGSIHTAFIGQELLSLCVQPEVSSCGTLGHSPHPPGQRTSTAPPAALVYDTKPSPTKAPRPERDTCIGVAAVSPPAC